MLKKLKEIWIFDFPPKKIFGNFEEKLLEFRKKTLN
jgi:hypothetical protein